MNTIIMLTLLLLDPTGKTVTFKNLAVTRDEMTCAKLADLLNKDPEKPVNMRVICRRTNPPTSI